MCEATYHYEFDTVEDNLHFWTAKEQQGISERPLVWFLTSFVPSIPQQICWLPMVDAFENLLTRMSFTMYQQLASQIAKACSSVHEILVSPPKLRVHQTWNDSLEGNSCMTAEIHTDDWFINNLF